MQKAGLPTMTEKPDAGEAEALAKRYLSLWSEYWASGLTAPETAALVAQMLKPLDGVAGTGLDAFFAQHDPRPEPTAVPASPVSGGGGAVELEGRIAALERRIAALEAKPEPGVAQHSRKPRGRPRKV
jgi:hypothetical protein